MNDSKKAIWPHLEDTYGKTNAAMWFHRWQIFYMACAELFAYESGETWGVSHYLFSKPQGQWRYAAGAEKKIIPLISR